MTEKGFLKLEKKINEWIIRLVRSDFQWLGRILLKGLRFAYRHRPIPVESSPKEAVSAPTGPYAVKRREQTGDLLLWVPHKINSFIIDELTGRFGYSHISVDTGEVDLPTGKPVMVEAMVGQRVERKFQDEYASRPYARIPLSKTGVDGEAFTARVISRLGEPYDIVEALTLGEIDDPAKQMCSGLASECLPESLKDEIARARRWGLLRRSSVSVYSPANTPAMKIFISPNGFAEYYGAPKGKKLGEPDFLVEPRPVDVSVKSVVRRHAWKAGLVLGIAVALAGITLFFIKKTN